MEWSVLGHLCQRNLSNLTLPLEPPPHQPRHFKTKSDLICYYRCPIVDFWEDQILVGRFEVGDGKKRNLRKDEKNQPSLMLLQS